MSRSALQLRYLGAMGIDAWVRRSPGPSDASAASDSDAAAGPDPSSEHAGRRNAGHRNAGEPHDDRVTPLSASPAEPRATDASSPAAASAQAPGRDLHALLDAPSPARSPAPEPEPGPVSEAVPASPAAPPRAVSGAAAALVPRFRIRVLGLGNGLLMIDEEGLPAEAREALQRAGDLLRAACLLRGYATDAPVESQVFHWPQVDDALVDQSMPRAIEALCAFARRRADAADGFLIVIDTSLASDASGASEQGTGAQAPLDALDALPLPRARIAGAFVTAPDSATDRAAWRALLRLRAGIARVATDDGAGTRSGRPSGDPSGDRGDV